MLWHYHASDALHLKHIQKIFGTRNLETFPISDIFTYKIFYNIIKKIKVYQLLNIDYDKANATAFLKRNTNGQNIVINIMNQDLQDFTKDIGC